MPNDTHEKFNSRGQTCDWPHSEPHLLISNIVSYGIFWFRLYHVKWLAGEEVSLIDSLAAIGPIVPDNNLKLSLCFSETMPFAAANICTLNIKC